MWKQPSFSHPFLREQDREPNLVAVYVSSELMYCAPALLRSSWLHFLNNKEERYAPPRSRRNFCDDQKMLYAVTVSF